MALKVIVTGTGRCGTVYMARVLSKLGIECGHESVFNVEAERTVIRRVSGEEPPTKSRVLTREEQNAGGFAVDVRRIVADSSYMAAPYLDREEVVGIPVVHCVRDPLSVISSFVLDLRYFRSFKNNKYNEQHWEEWITAHVPYILLFKNPIERACCFYVRWNEMIERFCKQYHPYFFHRIEDELPNRFFYFLGLDPTMRNTLVSLSKKANSMKKRVRDIRIDEIPDGELKEQFLAMRTRYGYKDPEQSDLHDDSVTYEVANLLNEVGGEDPEA